MVYLKRKNLGYFLPDDLTHINPSQGIGFGFYIDHRTVNLPPSTKSNPWKN